MATSAELYITTRTGKREQFLCSVKLAEPPRVGQFIDLPVGYRKGSWTCFEVQSMLNTHPMRLYGIYRMPFVAQSRQVKVLAPV